MRFVFFLLSISAVVPSVDAAETGLQTQLVRATYRLEHPKASGTGFVLAVPVGADSDATRLVLVTAAHGLEIIDDERITLVNRARQPDGNWTATPLELPLRRDDQPLWIKHPNHDVAVLPLELPVETLVESLPLTVLADSAYWAEENLEPGGLIRCAGYPHAAHFRPSPAGFPLVRMGCLASYPLTPFEAHPTFLVDYNTFEGDSGGPVYVVGPEGSVKILGLVHGQHFLDERFKTVYQQGMVRRRLGLAIIVNSQAILETLEMLPTQ